MSGEKDFHIKILENSLQNASKTIIIGSDLMKCAAEKITELQANLDTAIETLELIKIHSLPGSYGEWKSKCALERIKETACPQAAEKGDSR